MKKEQDYICSVLDAHYKNRKKTPQKEETEEASTKQKLRIRKAIIITLINLVLSIFSIIITFLPLIIILGVIGWWIVFLWNSSTYVEFEESDNILNFGSEHINMPIWFPVERGRLTYGFDYTKHKHSSWLDFLKIKLHGTHEYYDWHKGIDIAKTYWDIIKGYQPLIYTTMNWIILRLDSWIENWWKITYSRKSYNSGSFNETSYSIKKSEEKNKAPYGNHVIVSSIDWKYYTMFAHLSVINDNLEVKVERWNAIWRMWNTWNSTGDHLHYEIRTCWDNNSRLQKSWWQCEAINPLSVLPNNWGTFLWINELPKENSFFAWNIINIKDNIITDKEEIPKLIQKRDSVCKGIKLQQLNNSFNCDELFAIVEANKESGDFPLNKISNKEHITKIYIENEYWKILNNLSENEILTIAKLEQVTARNTEQLINGLSSKLSHGKFNNLKRAYKINEEANQIDDLILDLKWNNSFEERLLTIYDNWAYKKGENPFIYNEENKNKIFLPIRSPEGEVVKYFSWRWALTIFNTIKKWEK